MKLVLAINSLFFRRLALAAAFLFAISLSPLMAARLRQSYEEDRSVILREILESLNDLRYKVNNHEAEIRVFEEKFRTQEDIVDSVRQQVQDTAKVLKDSVKTYNSTLETKLASHQDFTQGITADFRAHAQDSASILAEYKKRILELEKAIEVQGKNLESMQTAMQAIMEVLQAKEMPSINQPINTKSYKVKSGDSLEKIAKHNNTTIKKLKELNNLTSDQIIIGQKLLLPE